MWRPNTAKNPTKSCAKVLTIFATCSSPSLCEQSELQCWRRNRRLHAGQRRKKNRSANIRRTLRQSTVAYFGGEVSYNVSAATDDYSGPTHIFDVRALLPIFYLERPKVMRRRCSPYTFQRTWDEARPNVGRDTIERRTRRVRTQEGVRYKV